MKVFGYIKWAILVLLVPIITASCATAQYGKSEPLPPFCSLRGPGCDAHEAIEASKDTLLSNGSTLEVSCEKRIEKKVDEPYMAECKKSIESLALALSAKWQGVLAPIDVSAIQYRQDGGDCIDGVNFGFCRYYAIAVIPLRWLAMSPNNSFNPTAGVGQVISYRSRPAAG